MNIIVDFENGYFVIDSPTWDQRAAQAPTSTKIKNTTTWLIDPDPVNIRYLTEQFDRKYFTAAAAARILQFKAVTKSKDQFPKWFKFKNQPMEEQKKALSNAYDDNYHALFMEMGTGKTFVTINVACARAQNGDINAMLVICPTAVIPVWDIEMEAHSPIDYDLHELRSGKAKATEEFILSPIEKLKVLVVGVEALSQGGAKALVEQFVRCHTTMAVLDESSFIKTPDAGRTKKAIFLGSGCKYRVILTGTSITQGLQDLYSQFRFLDWKIIGEKSCYTFKNRYCIMGGFESRTIIGYTNQDDLLGRVSPRTTIIMKSDMMDLPPKVYETIHIDPSPQQKKALKELGDPFTMATVVGDKLLEVETVLERMTRYMQIVGGHFPFKEEGNQEIMRFPGKNPKMEALLASIEMLPPDTKLIIWARFVPEIEWITEELNKRYPNEVTNYYGATPREDRKRILEDFQKSTGPRFFISNPSMGIGITLTAATFTYYYSNTFSLQDRMQSEDRNHRKGQENKVTYIDLIMKHQIDRSMIAALKQKKEIADYVNDELIERTR